MGTDMLACVDNGTDQPPAELVDVPAWFEEWEQILSRFRPESELSHLNRASNSTVEVSETLWQVFQSALSAEQLTEGLVTPTVAEAVVMAGYDQDFASLPRQQKAGLIPARPTRPLSLVQWDETSHSLRLPRACISTLAGSPKAGPQGRQWSD